MRDSPVSRLKDCHHRPRCKTPVFIGNDQWHWRVHPEGGRMELAHDFDLRTADDDINEEIEEYD